MTDPILPSWARVVLWGPDPDPRRTLTTWLVVACWVLAGVVVADPWIKDAQSPVTERVDVPGGEALIIDRSAGVSLWLDCGPGFVPVDRATERGELALERVQQQGCFLGVSE